MPLEHDAGGSIGRCCRCQDGIGTPFGVTVDGQSTVDSTVTLRDRDTLEQERVPIAKLGDELGGGWQAVTGRRRNRRWTSVTCDVGNLQMYVRQP